MIGYAAISDEFSPDLPTALRAMNELGMDGIELRVIGGRNVLDCSDAEIDEAKRAIDAVGLRIVALATPLLKCEVPNGPPFDPRFAHDIFGAAYTYADQPRLIARALVVAERLEVSLIRAFTFWRTVDPAACMDTITAAMHELAARAAEKHLTIALENEHACNVGTGAEVAAFLDAAPISNLQVMWDPANASILGERPFPDGYRAIPFARIAHVHAKDCRVAQHVPTWGLLGTMGVDWVGQVAALRAEGYCGSVSLETHWRGPSGDKFEASVLCGRALKSLLTT